MTCRVGIHFLWTHNSAMSYTTHLRNFIRAAKSIRGCLLLMDRDDGESLFGQ